MLGMSAFAFITPELPKLREMISNVSSSIERPIDDLDRGHDGSVSKARVKAVMEAVYKSTDDAVRAVKECERILATLREGSEEEIDALKIDEKSITELRNRASLIENGNARMQYAFFITQSDPAWQAHIATLNHLKGRLMPAFELYVTAVRELADTAEHFVPHEDGLAFDLNQMSESINSPTVKSPEWVNSSDDFVKWIRESK